MPHPCRVFARWGWNECQHESYAYTEVDQTVQFGTDLAGNGWQREQDKIGGVFVSNGIFADHQSYLAPGGIGFLLGDGGLDYGRENIVESYDNAHLWRGVFAGLDLQRHQPSRLQPGSRAGVRACGVFRLPLTSMS